MPAAVMDNFDRRSPFSQSDSQSPQEWGTQSDRHQRREKNRNAARKSRRKQTEKADLLHEELQTLEQSNAVIRKEIDELKKEIQMYTSALEQHEPHCTKLCPVRPSVSGPGASSTATPSTSNSTFVPDSNLLTDITFLHSDTNTVDLLLPDFLDDWTPWDSLSGNGHLQQF